MNASQSNEPITAVLEEWFGPAHSLGSGIEDPLQINVPAEQRKRWWSKDPAFDAYLKDRWGHTLDQALQGALDAWAQTAHGTLALIIVLDQLARNIHRGTAQMYAGDVRALALAQQAIEKGWDQGLSVAERTFLYMPFMHAENLSAQEKCIQLFEQLLQQAPEPHKQGLKGNIDFAKQHRDIVQRFARFPHRNALLKRESTPEEKHFLEQPGSSF